MYLVLAIIFAAVGLALLCLPRAVYRLLAIWKKENEREANSFQVLNLRIGGGVFVLWGVAWAIMYFWR